MPSVNLRTENFHIQSRIRIVKVVDTAGGNDIDIPFTLFHRVSTKLTSSELVLNAYHFPSHSRESDDENTSLKRVLKLYKQSRSPQRCQTSMLNILKLSKQKKPSHEGMTILT